MQRIILICCCDKFICAKRVNLLVNAAQPIPRHTFFLQVAGHCLGERRCGFIGHSVGGVKMGSLSIGCRATFGENYAFIKPNKQAWNNISIPANYHWCDMSNKPKYISLQVKKNKKLNNSFELKVYSNKVRGGICAPIIIRCQIVC